ncbi:MAG: bifunctional folylpolyglutamate synthase/dihydrofolate synthase, partial [Deltaproteobacteria bacterium]
FDYEGLSRRLWNVRLNLHGLHQVVNATTALGAMEVLEDLGYRVSTEAMMEGLKAVEWPGRLQMICPSPRVIVDGAHNPAGAQVLRETLEKDFHYRRLILLAGIMKDKDFKSILHILSPLADHILVSRPHLDRAAPPSLLLKALGENRQKAELIEDFNEAIARGISMTEKEDLFCITGSLYTVGEAISYFQSRRPS